MSEGHNTQDTATNNFYITNEFSILSLTLGLVLLLMAPVTLNFNVNLWSEGPVAGAGQTFIPMQLAYPGGIVAIILIMIVSLISVVFGLKGWSVSKNSSSSRVLSFTGLLVSFVSFILWIIVSLDLFFILDSFRYTYY